MRLPDAADAVVVRVAGHRRPPGDCPSRATPSTRSRARLVSRLPRRCRRAGGRGGLRAASSSSTRSPTRSTRPRRPRQRWDGAPAGDHRRGLRRLPLGGPAPHRPGRRCNSTATRWARTTSTWPPSAWTARSCRSASASSPGCGSPGPASPGDRVASPGPEPPVRRGRHTVNVFDHEHRSLRHDAPAEPAVYLASHDVGHRAQNRRTTTGSTPGATLIDPPRSSIQGRLSKKNTFPAGRDGL